MCLSFDIPMHKLITAKIKKNARQATLMILPFINIITSFRNKKGNGVCGFEYDVCGEKVLYYR
jgi:hypothetical protein